VVVALADVERLQLRAEVDEADVAAIAPGQAGYATAEAFGTVRIAGHVERVMAELGRKKIVTDDPRARIDTRVLEVLFVPDEPHPVLPLGLRMDVHLEAGAGGEGGGGWWFRVWFLGGGGGAVARGGGLRGGGGVWGRGAQCGRRGGKRGAHQDG